jgi:hypothetical protein
MGNNYEIKQFWDGLFLLNLLPWLLPQQLLTIFSYSSFFCAALLNLFFPNIQQNAIKTSFKTCGITNAFNGSEGNLIKYLNDISSGVSVLKKRVLDMNPNVLIDKRFSMILVGS